MRETLKALYSFFLPCFQQIKLKLVQAGGGSSSLLECLLLLLSPAEAASGDVVAANVIQILDLVDTDNPVLASESLLQCIKGRTLGRHGGVSNSINSSSRREHACVIVVGHLVPKGRKSA